MINTAKTRQKEAFNFTLIYFYGKPKLYKSEQNIKYGNIKTIHDYLQENDLKHLFQLNRIKFSSINLFLSQ